MPTSPFPSDTDPAVIFLCVPLIPFLPAIFDEPSEQFPVLCDVILLEAVCCSLLVSFFIFKSNVSFPKLLSSALTIFAFAFIPFFSAFPTSS